MDIKEIGKRICEYRAAAGLSQQELANAVEVTTNYISYIERGMKAPSLKCFIKIANYINVSADLLLADVIDNTQKEQAAGYLSRIEKLPPKERRRILALIETYLSEM